MTFLLKETNEVFQIHWKLLTIDLMIPIACWVHKIIKWKWSWYCGWGFRWTARRLTFCHELVVSPWESHKSFWQYKNRDLKWYPFVTGKFSKPNDNLYICFETCQALKPVLGFCFWYHHSWSGVSLSEIKRNSLKLIYVDGLRAVTVVSHKT